MKVMCIAKDWETPGIDPAFGEIVTVVDTIDLFVPCYVLAEYPRPGGYVKVGFISMEDDDEVEQEQGQQLETNETAL